MTTGHLNHTALNVSTISPPPDCLVLPYLQYLPWHNPSNIISAHVEDMVRRWKDAVVLPILFLIGAPANIINMAVFRKQGLKERINVCLFALSLADFLFLLQICIFHGENMDVNRKERYGALAVFWINHNLTALTSFTWVSQVLSAIIASERCFCVLWPLRSKTILRTSTTTVIVIIVNVIIVAPYFLIAFRYRIGCVYDPKQGVSFLSTVIEEFYVTHKAVIDFLHTFIYGVFLSVMSVVIVTATTIVTAIKLREAARWRSGTSSVSGTGSRNSLTSREIALTKMLVCTSVLFITCLFPLTMYSLASLFLPEMNVGGQQHNLFLVGIWMNDVFCTINSTFNFLVYYSVGSRYRHTFWQLMGKGQDTGKETIVGNSQSSKRCLSVRITLKRFLN